MDSRRNFIKKSTILGTGISLLPGLTFGINNNNNNKHHNLKIGMIGVGLRGTNHLDNLLLRDDITITAICDIDPKRIDIAVNKITSKGQKKPLTFGKDDYDYRNLLDLNNVDAVIISTPWLWHTLMAKDTMRAGKYTGLEVSAANTMEECWDLVNTHEETGTHLMILENVNYRRDVMAVLNMVKQNVFGELLHFRCGYQHDLRHVKFNDGKTPYGKGVEFGEKGISESAWRTQHSLLRNADIYPTHGIGPVAAMCDINRGNRFMTLTSTATKAVGLHNYIVENGGKHHPNAKLNFKLGDVITSTIETSNGESIIVTHDTNSPRPYSLGFRVQGANGLWEVDGNRIHIDKITEPHKWDKADEWLKKYDHPLWKKFGDLANGSGHGGMDFFVIHAFVEAAKKNIAPPMDAYDAAAWSAITPLSEASIENNGEPQDFPDFTRGNWVKRKPYNWIKNTY
ncbi:MULTISPECIES: Gfo/Idh/MocA family protein [unclassified Cellulophaga]|uniref:Gfo/Idh/MocA family protein n=1 Tax=unclassified Cellulophaga TaxID=2634405 RepID=UPI0026E2A7BA|nr:MULTISPECIES: Gfo/Idh/MocA family oxidoreductase [unclassified Cellulophaga]MDO6492240.1 Gfo/Idh/MocA family oxidoreductase [Cellulophaga sp. 2_MG-2023]MDO6493190.1 Gfo/Idh/MocA family oxidoreductase [Cellulophaga sp. 3_MG-2023]